MVWITKDDEKEAAELMNEWEKQGCTYEDVEKKLTALNSYFSKCKREMIKQPFKTLS